MIYLQNIVEIKNTICDLQDLDILWLDTEVADYKTKNPRLSLIQLLACPDSIDGERTYIFDVLDNQEITSFFIDKIMKNNQIIKVFHNAKYDLKFLGKKEAKNIICTLELARKIPYYILPVKRYNLKKLTEYLTQFQDLSKEEQGSDWGIRPLTSRQLAYAKMDCVYLAQVYLNLIKLQEKYNIPPEEENIDRLLQRHQEIYEQWSYIDSEKKHLETRIKEAMLTQNSQENSVFQLTSIQRKNLHINLQDLIKVIEQNNLNFDFKIKLTKEIQGEIDDYLSLLNTEVEIKEYYQLRNKISSNQ